ncbi:SDR family NAD(P)-dependent oxidoreductase [Salinispora arenicola]|uniref:SDR family NAD(P)-dependent oxidoreductase n=1 Tax=Salinispora arenicola TaxID=168697 RepID=UPI003F5CDED9
MLACASSLAEPDELDDAVGDVLDAFRSPGRPSEQRRHRPLLAGGDGRSGRPPAHVDVHVKGPVHLLRACLPELRARRGSVVNVTSVGGALATPHRSFYGASKAAINHLTRSLAIELAPEVRVNAVLPGPVDTPIYDDLGLSDEATGKLREDLMARTPMGRFGSPTRWPPGCAASSTTNPAG